MKSLLATLALTLMPVLAAPAEYTEILSTYVNEQGVDYARLHQSPADLAKLDTAAQYYADSAIPKDTKEALCWHLNAYNVWILKKIMDKYPTKGPISGTDKLFFHKKQITIAGRKTSFDHLEQKVIRPVYKESRIHFALNCASVSCPPLRNEPFRAEVLDAQLNEQAYKFINSNPLAVSLSDTTANISKIFDWYAVDFGGHDKLVTWLNFYRQPKLAETTNVEFQKYDWSLNQQ